MDAVTFGGIRAPITALRERDEADTSDRLFARFMSALRESRLREARRVLERHAYIFAVD